MRLSVEAPNCCSIQYVHKYVERGILRELNIKQSVYKDIKKKSIKSYMDEKRVENFIKIMKTSLKKTGVVWLKKF